MPTNIRSIFDNLEGNWTFQRTIHDVLKAVTNQATGKASFTFANSNNSNVLDYEEKGTLTLSANDRRIPFSRKYIYQFVNNTIEIILNDGVTKGGLFQKLIPTDHACRFTGTEHICRLDKHNGSYFFENENAFQTTFSVVGTKTNLQITTSYTKR